MTPEQLANIQARADAATEGPWEHQPYGGQNQNGDYSGGHIFDADGEYVVSEVADKDGAFISHARTDVPALLALVREQAATLDRVKEVIRDCGFDYDVDTPTVVEVAAIRAALTATEGAA